MLEELPLAIQLQNLSQLNHYLSFRVFGKEKQKDGLRIFSPKNQNQKLSKYNLQLFHENGVSSPCLRMPLLWTPQPAQRNVGQVTCLPADVIFYSSCLNKV